jgi:RecB family exonuclease
MSSQNDTQDINGLLDELDAIETTYLYYDRRWDQVRECDRGDTDDEKYVRFSDLQAILDKFKTSRNTSAKLKTEDL